jgi:hypothetical protein
LIESRIAENDLLEIRARAERFGAATSQEFRHRATRELEALRELVKIGLALFETLRDRFLTIAK